MKKNRLVNVLGLAAVTIIISGCSSIQHKPVSNRTSHFMCFNQDKSKEHYFTNTFTLEPIAEQKQYEILLVKRRMEKQLQIKLVDCKGIAESEVPKDIGI